MACKNFAWMSTDGNDVFVRVFLTAFRTVRFQFSIQIISVDSQLNIWQLISIDLGNPCRKEYILENTDNCIFFLSKVASENNPTLNLKFHVYF